MMLESESDILIKPQKKAFDISMKAEIKAFDLQIKIRSRSKLIFTVYESLLFKLFPPAVFALDGVNTFCAFSYEINV